MNLLDQTDMNSLIQNPVIKDWLEEHGYKESDVMINDEGLEYVIYFEETDHSDDFEVTKKKLFLDEILDENTLKEHAKNN